LITILYISLYHVFSHSEFLKADRYQERGTTVIYL